MVATVLSLRCQRLRHAAEPEPETSPQQEASRGKYTLGTYKSGEPVKVSFKVKNTFIECFSSDDEDEDESTLPVGKMKSCPVNHANPWGGLLGSVGARLPASPREPPEPGPAADVDAPPPQERPPPLPQEPSESGLAAKVDAPPRQEQPGTRPQLPEHCAKAHQELGESHPSPELPGWPRLLGNAAAKPKLSWAAVVRANADQAQEAEPQGQAQQVQGPGQAAREEWSQQSPAEGVLIPVPAFGTRGANAAAFLPVVEALAASAPEEEDALSVVPGASSQVVPLAVRQPGDSLGSAEHGTGDCKPCAWFWRPQGCVNGLECRHCHTCPIGAIKDRRKRKLHDVRSKKKQSDAPTP